MSGPELRPYQLTAIEKIRERFAAGDRATLLILATGLGKTVVFADVARRTVERGGRALILAHRGELLDQARAKLEALGLSVELEKASEHAGDAPVVVASVQTLRGDRLASWPADAFRLIVIDEAHHSAAKSYRDIADHFEAARILGVTATPDRLDGKGLGDLFDSVAVRYELRDAIRDGWLSPLKAQRVHVAGLDLSKVRTVAGDLNQGDLDLACRVPEAISGIADPLLKLSGERQTLLFLCFGFPCPPACQRSELPKPENRFGH